MVSVEDNSIFEHYYQASYDFNTSSLNEQEIEEIKTLAKEKRLNYALAPIGENIFEFISEQCPNIHFELVELDNKKVDGMLYIPKSGQDKAYIILNANKPLINQIFAAAHEYYHYIKDYEAIKEKPYVCCLSSLKNINEKRASRFAAELLLPDNALEKELTLFKKRIIGTNKKKLDFAEYASMSMILTIKYQLPLKAVIYRLHEENYIKNIDDYIKKYEFIKNVLLQVKILKEQIDHLYSNINKILDNRIIIYQQIEKAYNNGFVSRDEIMRDANVLELDKSVINSMFDELDTSDEEQDDSDLINILKEKWGGK